MSAYGAHISVDATLEALIPVACKPLALGQRLAPVVAAGKALTGKLKLTGPASGSFSGLSLALHTYAARADSGAWQVVTLAEPTKVPLELKTDATYQFDASGKVELPFSVDAAVIPLIDTLSFDGALCVHHELELVLVLPGRAEPLRVVQPLALQVPTDWGSAPVPAPADKPWLTVGDFAGTAKLELNGAANCAWPLGRTIDGELTIKGTTPLLRAKLLLVAGVNGSDEARIVCEKVVWEAADATTGASPDLSVHVSLSLGATPTTPLCPSLAYIEAGGVTVGIEHGVRLQLEGADGLSGWNTIPVVIGRGPNLTGSKVGSLAKPTAPKDPLSRPVPKARGRSWTKLMLIGLTFMLTLAAADAGVAHMDGEESRLAIFAKQMPAHLDLLREHFGLSPPEAIKPKGRPQNSRAEKSTAAEVKEMLGKMTDAQVRDALVHADVDFDEDELSAKELRKLASKTLTIELLKRRVEVEKKYLSKEAKMRMVLRKKPVEEIKWLLSACEIEWDENATVKDLRHLAFETNVLDKWEKLPDDVKLKWNQARAVQGVRAHDAKEQERKERRKAEKEAEKEALAEKTGNPFAGNPMLDRKELPEWEVEWDQYQEEETLERLSRLPMWDTMSPDMLQKMVSRIRRDPGMLDMLEGEARSMAQMKEMQGPNGEMPTLRQLREIGMDTAMHKFDKSAKVELDLDSRIG